MDAQNNIRHIMDIRDNYKQTNSKGQEAQSLYEKVVGYAKATYLVTTVVKDSEPLKGQVRNVANRLIEDISDFAYVERYAGSSQTSLVEVRELVSELLIFFHIGSLSLILSKMNYEILKNEGEKILMMIDAVLADHTRVGMLSSDFFSSQREDRAHLLFPVEKHPMQSSQVGVISSPEHSRPLSDSSRVTKKGAVTQGEGVSAQIKDSGNRTDKIIAFMKGKEKLSVTDIAAGFKDCSEKTIQRELVNLVASGKVVKEGERRWSRYTVVS